MAVIGSVGWKRKSFRRLVYYIDNDKGRLENDRRFPAIYHNIFESTPKAATTAFRDNESRRKVNRRDSIKAYHEYISFHIDDKPSIKALEDLAYKWINLRSNGQEAICFARAHLDQKNVHIHFAFSGVDIYGKALRLSDKDFLKIRLEHEQYQKEKYPELQHSIVYLDKERFKRLEIKASDRAKRTQNEYRRTLRTSDMSHKEICRLNVEQTLVENQSFSGFEKSLTQKGFGLYKRRGRLEGITFKGRKYRFRTLELDLKMLRLLDSQRENHELYRKKVASLKRYMSDLERDQDRTL